MVESAENDEVIVEDSTEEDELEITAEEDENEETEETEEDAEEEAEEEDETDDRDQEFETLKKDLEAVKKDNARLGFALRQQKKEPAAKDDTEKFSDSQLVGLMREHKDDPDVLFQVVKKMVDQQGSDIKKETVDGVETKRVKANLDGFLDQKFPDWRKEDSEVKTHITKTMDDFQLSDHPYGEFLSMAAHMVTQIDNIVEEAVKVAKDETLNKKANDTRKAEIEKTKLSAKGKKKATSAAIPEEYQEVSKMLDLTESQKKIYAKMRKSGSKQITVGA